MASITLTRFGSEVHASSELPRQSAWPISIAAYGYDMPSAVFVYHVGDGVLQGDIFEAVASPLQLHELPVNKPVPGIPYYRRSILEFLCRSAEEAAYVWDTVNEEVEFLVRDFNAGSLLESVEQTSYGDTLPAVADSNNEHPLSGNGSPEGVVVAEIGEIYWDRFNKVQWVKDSGTGNTGWLALVGI